ncbi:MAG: UxaA family hydrolase [Acidobacteriota bacterium]
MDRRLVLLAPEDNCVVVAYVLSAGEHVEIDGVDLIVGGAVTIGHKLARRAIAEGEKVIKYGAIIGHAMAAIPAGAHIHTHNLDSDYIQTFTLAPGQAFVAPRV